MPPPCHPLSLPDSRLQSLSTEQDHQLRGAKIFERKCCLLVTRNANTQTHKQGVGVARSWWFETSQCPVFRVLACVVCDVCSSTSPNSEHARSEV
jgi:hypothetical protein